MSKTQRLLVLATPLIAASLIAAGPAVAKNGGGGGGGGGGGTPTPAPPPPTTDPCAAYADLPAFYPDGSQPIVAPTSAGCVLIRLASPQTLTLTEVAPLPGWTYQVKDGGNTSSRVQIEFVQTATGQKLGFRMEPGKTVIG